MPPNHIQFEGQEVKDATSRVVIEVNRADIAGGKTKMPNACAAARACVRQVPKCTQAKVFLSRTYLKVGDKWLRYHTPPSMRLEIAAFDRGTNFLPGIYVLAPMQPSHRKGGKAQGGKDTHAKKKSRGKPKKKNLAYHRLVGVREFSLK